MNKSIYEQTKAALEELCIRAKLVPGNIVVVGCSTSEVLGAKIGTNSNPDVAGEIFRALRDCADSKGVYLAIQCCEHLNRAIIIDNEISDIIAGNMLCVRADGEDFTDIKETDEKYIREHLVAFLSLVVATLSKGW